MFSGCILYQYLVDFNGGDFEKIQPLVVQKIHYSTFFVLSAYLKFLFHGFIHSSKFNKLGVTYLGEKVT